VTIINMPREQMKPLHTATSGSCCLTNSCGPKITGFFPQFCSLFCSRGPVRISLAYSDDHKKWGKGFGAFGVFSSNFVIHSPSYKDPCPCKVPRVTFDDQSRYACSNTLPCVFLFSKQVNRGGIGGSQEGSSRQTYLQGLPE
jgi:hypothetical protein